MVKVVSRLVLACGHSAVGAEATLAQRLAAQDEPKDVAERVGLVDKICKIQERSQHASSTISLQSALPEYMAETIEQGCLLPLPRRKFACQEGAASQGGSHGGGFATMDILYVSAGLPEMEIAHMSGLQVAYSGSP